MKYNGTLMSACALLVAVTACHAITAQNEAQEEVTVYNRTGGTIYGDMYLTNKNGKVIGPLDQGLKKIDSLGLIKTTVSKPSKKTGNYMLIFSTDPKSLADKIAGKSSKNIISKKIDPFKVDAPSSYTIRLKDANKSFRDIQDLKDGAKYLKIN